MQEQLLWVLSIPTVCQQVAIDYRGTCVYGIRNRHTPPIVLHWAALKHSPEYLALASINWKVTFLNHLSSSCMNSWAVHSKNGGRWWSWEVVRLVWSFVRLLDQKPGAVWSKWLAQGKLEFLSSFTERYLRLSTLWTPSDYLYLVEVHVLHRHLLNLQTSLRKTLWAKQLEKIVH